jgi:hypothetical protein
MSSAQMRDPATVSLRRQLGTYYPYAMLIAKSQGANGLQLCNSPTIVHSSPPSHKSKSNIYPSDKPQSPRFWQQQASTATPTLKDESLRAPHYHDLSCDHLTQKHQVQSDHLIPQSDVSKHGTLIIEAQQNSCLQGGVNSTSGPQVSRCSSSRESVPS